MCYINIETYVYYIILYWEIKNILYVFIIQMCIYAGVVDSWMSVTNSKTRRIIDSSFDLVEILVFSCLFSTIRTVLFFWFSSQYNVFEATRKKILYIVVVSHYRSTTVTTSHDEASWPKEHPRHQNPSQQYNNKTLCGESRR
jgi:hypothetical protein